jgi:hypothetical protein
MHLPSDKRSKIFIEVNRIAQQLIDSSISEGDDKIYWESLNYTGEGYSWRASESLYSGVAGIALFFVELYRFSNDIRFLQYAQKAGNWLCDNQLSDRQFNMCGNNFFTGKTGVSFFLIRLYQFTSNEKYLQCALAIGEEPTNDSFSQNGVFDLLNGSAGELLGLLHIYSEFPNEVILNNIDALLNNTIESVKITNHGIYWDSRENGIHSLCGFSHGTSGVGFVLDEVMNYWNIDSLKTLSNLSRAYENHYYDSKESNWADLRREIHDEKTFLEHKDRYESGDIYFFTKPHFMNAWCHGAVGIAFSRLRSWALWNTPIDRSDYLKVLSSFSKNEEPSLPRDMGFTLCHGSGAIIDLFLFAYKLENDDYYLSIAMTFAAQLISFRESEGKYYSGHSGSDEEDSSLFMGIAGVGYVLLRILDPLTIPSILMPIVESKVKNFLITDRNTKSSKEYNKLLADQTILSMYQNLYPRTVSLIEQIVTRSELLKLIITPFTELSIHSVFRTGIKTIINTIPSPESREVIQEVFNYENIKIDCDENIDNCTLLNIERIVQSERIQIILNSTINQMQTGIFSINPRIVSHFSKCDCRGNEMKMDNLQNEISKQFTHHVLLLPAPEMTEEFWLQQQVSSLLSCFSSPIRFEDARNSFISLPALGKIEKDVLSVFFIDQFMELLKSRIVLDIHSYDQVLKMQNALAVTGN